MSDKFSDEVARLAIDELRDDLVQAQRNFEDAQRTGDAYSAARAMRDYNSAKLEFDKIVNDPQRQAGQLSGPQQNFLARRQALGDELTPQRMADYARGHVRAVAAGLEEDSPAYFKAIEMHVDNLGDGRQKPLDEREAARLCDIDDATYAANADKLRWLKQRGFYQE